MIGHWIDCRFMIHQITCIQSQISDLIILLVLLFHSKGTCNLLISLVSQFILSPSYTFDTVIKKIEL